MRIKVIIYNGIIQTVLGDDDASQSGLKVEVINFDSETDEISCYNEEYDKEGLIDIPYTATDCGKQS